MQLLAEFRVAGKPEPQGSAQAFVPLHPKTKKPYRRPNGGIVVNVTSDNKNLKAWRKTVAEVARQAFQLQPVGEAGVSVEVISYLKRPDAQWGTGRNAHLLKDTAPAYPITKPDTDKLLRAALDAITEVVIADDSLVTDAVTRKRFAIPNGEDDGLGAVIRVWKNEAQLAAQLPMEERVRVVPPRPADDEDEGDPAQPSLLAA